MVILSFIMCVCVFEFISVSDGACCARQPGSSGATLCGQGTVCPLSCCFEFTTNLQRQQQQHPRLYTAADGSELAALVCARVCPFLFGEATVKRGALPAAASSFMCRKQRVGGWWVGVWGSWGTIEIKLWSVRDHIKRKNLPYHSVSSREAAAIFIILEIMSLHGGQWAYCCDLVAVIQLSTICNRQQYPLQSCSVQ